MHFLPADLHSRHLQAQCSTLVDLVLAPQSRDLLRRLIASRSQVLELANLTNVLGFQPSMPGRHPVNTTELPRMLMSLRQALPACEYEVLQNLPAEPIDPVFADSAAGLPSFEVRCRQRTWDLFQDASWTPERPPPGLHMNFLTRPLIGQGLAALCEQLRPFLGHQVLSCQVRRAHADDMYNDRSHLCHAVGTATVRFVSSADLPAASGGGVVEGVFLRTHTIRRMGGRLAREQTVALDWDTNDYYDSVGSFATPYWQTVFGAGFSALESGHAWRLAAVWALPSPNHDTLTHTGHLPSAYGLCLELEPAHLPPARHVHAGIDSHAPAVYLCFYARQDEGFDPQVTVSRGGMPADPYGAGWRLLLCGPPRGALPKLEAAFAELFSHWAMELPAELVALRAPMPGLDDGWDGFTGWQLDGRFGRDAAGEYLDLDRYHRHCGEEYLRIYADGRVLDRQGPGACA